MPEIREDQYQTPEQRRAVEECLNLYSRERKKLIEEYRRKQNRLDDGLPFINCQDKIIDMAPSK